MDYRLSVDRQHVLEGLKRFKTRRTPKGGTAVFGFDGSFFMIEAHDIMVLAQAVGAWPGNALVNATLVHALAAAPPVGDPIIVSCDGEHVQFGPVKVGCKWQPVSSIMLARPRQAEWIEMLSLKYTLPRGRIIASGKGSELKAAERKLAALVRRVAKSLGPFGVTAADVLGLVERRLEERYVATGRRYSATR